MRKHGLGLQQPLADAENSVASIIFQPQDLAGDSLDIPLTGRGLSCRGKSRDVKHTHTSPMNSRTHRRKSTPAALRGLYTANGYPVTVLSGTFSLLRITC